MKFLAHYTFYFNAENAKMLRGANELNLRWKQILRNRKTCDKIPFKFFRYKNSMKNKAVAAGIIALVLLGSVVFFCFWAGKKISEKLTGTNETTETTQTPTSGKVPPPANPQEAQAVYLALGNPNNATPNTANADNFLLVNNFYALSYNRSRATANWVAWRVTKADMSDLSREDSFRPDDRLPKSWGRITPSDYTGSGYDRGHICPS